MRLYLNRKAWRPRHWVVLVACVAAAKLADFAADGWWSWVALALFLILLHGLPRDFVGLKRRSRVPKNQENGWEALMASLAFGFVALVLTAMTIAEYSRTPELRAHGVTAPRPGTVTVSTDKNDEQHIEVLFTTKRGSSVTGTVEHRLDPQPAVGDRIAVRYSPSDPELIAMASYPMGYGYVVFGGVLSAVVWILAALMIRSEYRTRHSV